MKATIYQNVLVLNKHWIPIGVSTVKKALEDMCSSKNPKKALVIEYAEGLSGEYDFATPSVLYPATWEEWSKLAPRPYDDCFIKTVSLKVRVPRVIISNNYDKIPVKTFRPTKQTLFAMQKGRDAYTGEETPYNQMNIDHVIPRSRGGSNHFENLVLCHKQINLQKGDRTPEEAGLKLKIKNKMPKPVPFQATIHAMFQDWKLFLH